MATERECNKVLAFRPRRNKEEAERLLVDLAFRSLQYHRDIEAGKLSDVEIVMRGANLRRELLTIGENYGL